MSEPVESQGGPEYRFCSLEECGRKLQALGLLAIFPSGLMVFSLLALAMHPRYSLAEAFRAIPGLNNLEVAGISLAYGFLLFLPLIALHEYAHGVAFRWAGCKPQYGTTTLKNGMQVFYTSCRDHWIPCRQYRVVLAAPTVLVNVVGMLAMVPPTPVRYYMVVALTLHLSGCVGDWWMLSMLRQVPSDTLIEDVPDGFRYPAPQ